MSTDVKGRRRARKQEHAEHVNHERWLVTYADMITLLMVLFIVLFAISQVDRAKFEALAAGLASGFGQIISVTPGSSGVLPNSPGEQFRILDMEPAISAAALPSLAADVAQGMTHGGSGMRASAETAAIQDTSALDRAQNMVTSSLRKAGLADQVKLTRDARGLTITVIVNSLVFPADRATLQPAGHHLLNAIAPALKAAKHDIVIEGNTNTVAAHPKFYPSEWELSSARSSAVARYLVSPLGVDPKMLSVVGYADTRPLIPASDPRSTTMNRRVSIVVLSSLTGAQRALLDTVPSTSVTNPT